MRPLVILLLAGLVCGLSPESSAMGPRPPGPKPRLMAVLGDSIAAGTLADVPIPHAPTPEESVRLWHDQGVEANFLYTNKRTLSWGSGEKIRSHFVLLRQWMKEHGIEEGLEVANLSKPGAETSELAGQVDRLNALLDEGGYSRLDYVAVDIGSNDACNWNPAKDFPLDEIRENVLRALAAIAKGLKRDRPDAAPTRVLLVGVPRVPNLGTPAIRNSSTLFGLSCATVRDRILRYCNPLTVWSGEAEYLERLAVVESVNGVLRSAALEAGAIFPGLEVAYSDRLFQLEIPLGALAADCFHPGRWAQELIALQTWKDQPWFH